MPGDGETRDAPGNPVCRAHPFVVVPPRASKRRGARLCRGHYGAFESRGPIAPIAEDGIGRAVGGGGGARFQQHADHHPGSCRDAAGQGDAAGGTGGLDPGDLLRGGAGGGIDPAAFDVQPQKRHAAEAAGFAGSGDQHEQEAGAVAGRDDRASVFPATVPAFGERMRA